MKMRIYFKIVKVFFAGFLFIMFSINHSYGIIIDRLAAYVDDSAITFSEFEEEFQKFSNSAANITQKEVLDSMINRLLLIKEARNIRFDSHSEDELLNHYLDIKIRSRLFIKEDEVVNFYKKNIEEFKGQDYHLVKDQIEAYLLEKEFNDILKKHIEELRQKAEIRVLIKDK